MKKCKELLEKLAEASLPFTSGCVVDETMGTEPLMSELGELLREVEEYLDIEFEIDPKDFPQGRKY